MSLYARGVVTCLTIAFGVVFGSLTPPAPAYGQSSGSKAETHMRFMWEAAKQSQNAQVVLAFRNSFPDSPYDMEALVLLTELMQTARSAQPAQPEPTIILSSVPSEEVSFTGILHGRGAALDGQSIAKLLQGSPAYPPVGDLPKEAWADKQCSSCHKWDTATLCSQSKSYLWSGNQTAMQKKHPLGTEFKVVLRDWAQGDCR